MAPAGRLPRRAGRRHDCAVFTFRLVEARRLDQTAADPSGSRRSHGSDARSGLVPATVAHDVDHDVADLVALVDVPVRLDDLGHRIDAVDHDLKAVLAE